MNATTKEPDVTERLPNQIESYVLFYEDLQVGERFKTHGTIVMKRVAVNQRGEEVMESVWHLAVKAREQGASAAPA